MKKVFYIFLTLALGLGACSVEDYSENPNVPSDAPLSTLLPPTQKALADAQGGRLFRYTNIFAQQLVGVDNQEALIEVYNPDELFVDIPWADLYVDAMINLRIIIQKGDNEGSPHYAGIARIQMAQCLGLLSDIWGDVPYSEALQGSEFPSPAFDSQEEIYATIFSLLDRAISDLDQAESIFSPSSDDLVYNGDLDSWKRAARVLKSRYILHTSKRSSSVYQEALDALAEGGFTGDGQDFQYAYLGTGTDINPIFSFYEITPYAYIDQDFKDLIEELQDPREDFIFRTIPFSGGNRKPGDFFASAESPVKLASYLEELFIRAEANLQLGGDAQSLLNQAIQLSMDQLSDNKISQEDVDAYITANAQLNGSLSENLEKLITQKYIALFTSPETWTDFRRTGFPQLEPNPNGTNGANPNGEIPRRLIYPQSERLRNENFPSPAPNMQDRFWWDQ